MSILYCSDDPYVLARWRGCNCDALEITPAQLPRYLAEDTPRICVLDVEAVSREMLDDLLSHNPHVQFLLMVAEPQPHEGVQLLRAGSRGYANRFISPALLHAAIETIEAGEFWAGADTIRHLLRQRAATAAPPPPDTTAIELLSARELEVARLVQAGQSNKQIAQQLGITERTVKAHLNAAYGKTETKGRLQLALWLGRQHPKGLRAQA